MLHVVGGDSQSLVLLQGRIDFLLLDLGRNEANLSLEAFFLLWLISHFDLIICE